MSKKNPGAAPRPITGSDQDSLSPEETAALDAMEKGEGADGDAPAARSADGAADVGKGAEGEGEHSKEKMVPHGALHQEREERKRADAALSKEREERAAERTAADQRFSTLEQRTNLILEKLVPKEEPAKVEPEPDPATDPAGWITHQMAKTGKSVEQLQSDLKGIKDREAQSTETTKQNEIVRALVNEAVTLEKDFIAENPDYVEAGKFLSDTRIKQLLALGYTKDQTGALLNNERLALIARSKEAKLNPAKMVYDLAQAMGYTKKAAKAAAEGATAEEKLAALGRGQEQSQSLSATNGGAPAPLTAKRLLEMSEAEFGKAMKTPEGKALMG